MWNYVYTINVLTLQFHMPKTGIQFQRFILEIQLTHLGM